MTRHIQNHAIVHYSAIFRTLDKACIRKNLAYSESWNIQNPSLNASQRIFRTLPQLRKFMIFETLTYLKPNTYSEPSQKFTMDFFAKIVKNYIKFSKALHLRSLTRFWIQLFLNKYSLTCRLTLRYVRILSIIVNSDIFMHIHILFRHIHAYSRPIQKYSSIFMSY